MSRRRRGLASLGIFVVVALAWIALAPALRADPHEPVDFAWTVTIDRDGLDDRNAISIDQATVRLIEGSLSVFSASAVECPHEHRSGVLGRLLGMPEASAGHGEGSDTTVRGPVVVNLLSTGPAEIGRAAATEPSYCEMHVAFAGATAAERLAGSDAPTLLLDVEIQRLGEPVTRRTIETTSPMGQTVELNEQTLAPSTTATVRLAPLLDVIANSATDIDDDALAAAVLAAIQMRP